MFTELSIPFNKIKSYSDNHLNLFKSYKKLVKSKEREILYQGLVERNCENKRQYALLYQQFYLNINVTLITLMWWVSKKISTLYFYCVVKIVLCVSNNLIFSLMHYCRKHYY